MALLQQLIILDGSGDSGNVFEGTEYEFLGRPARITLSAVQGSDANAKVTWTSGSVLLIDAADFAKSSGVDPDFPIIPDNVLDAETVLPGQRNILRFKGDANKKVAYRLDIDF